MHNLQQPRSRVKKQKPCTCSAYSFPHRPNGGDCLYDRYLTVAARIEDEGFEPDFDFVVECVQATGGGVDAVREYFGAQQPWQL